VSWQISLEECSITTFVGIGDACHKRDGFIFNRDGKPVDFNDMVIVIVKCFDYNWMSGSESD